MTIEKLKALLAGGQITQEEFEEMAKNLNGMAPEEQSESDSMTESESTGEGKEESLDYDKLDKIIQARVDKQMAAERKKTVELRNKLERLQREKLTDEELKNLELENKEKEIAEREKAIADKENRLFAVKAIKEAGLDDGSDTSLALVDFVIGEDEAEIKSKVKSFKELFDKAVASEVNRRFKENGCSPKTSGSLNGGRNPYRKDQFSLTEQMKIEVENPELAKQLQAAAI